MVLIADEGVPILVRETREEIVRNKSQDVADETLVPGEVAPEHEIVDLAVGVVGGVFSVQNEDPVVQGNVGVVDKLAEASVGEPNPDRVVSGVVDLARSPGEKEINANVEVASGIADDSCDVLDEGIEVVAEIGPEPLVEAVADVPEVVAAGGDAASDPRGVDSGVVGVAAVDVDGIVEPEAVRIGGAVVGDPDGHIIVTAHDTNDPCTIVEDCDASNEHAVVGIKVEDDVHVVVDA